MQQLTCVGIEELEWREVALPRIEADTDALVRPLAVARCDIDRLMISGAIPQRGPFSLGHECVGEVLALGDAVEGLEIGARVVVAFQLSCGRCRTCENGHSANCDTYPTLSDYGMQPLSGVEYGGMLSDCIRVPFANAMLRRVAPDLDPVDLASVSDNVLDGYRAVAPHLRAQPEQEVLVVSHGGQSIPLYAAQAAQVLGASRVHYASADPEQLALAERLGANPIETDFGERAGRFPIVVDAGLRPEGLAFALRCAEPEGICQSVSFYPAPVTLELGRLYTLGIRFFMGRCHASSLLPEVMGLIEAGALQPGLVTTRVVEWEDALDRYNEPATKLIVRRPGLEPFA